MGNKNHPLGTLFPQLVCYYISIATFYRRLRVQYQVKEVVKGQRDKGSYRKLQFAFSRNTTLHQDWVDHVLLQLDIVQCPCKRKTFFTLYILHIGQINYNNYCVTLTYPKKTLFKESKQTKYYLKKLYCAHTAEQFSCRNILWCCVIFLWAWILFLQKEEVISQKCGY